MTNFLKRFMWVVAYLMFTFSFIQAIAQNEKIDKDEAKFCQSVSSFLISLEDLESANLRMDITNFTDAYKNVDKAWNKMRKSTKKLEKLNTKSADKAYNELVKTLETVVTNNVKSSVNMDKIAKQIVTSRKTINQIKSPTCK